MLQNALTILRKSAALFQKFSKKGLSGAAWRNAKVDHMNQNDPVPDDFTLSPAFVDALPALFFFCLQHGTGGRNFAFIMNIQ